MRYLGVAMENLTKQTWFLGELNSDAATAVLSSSGRNTFIVYKDIEKNAFALAFSSQQDDISAVEISGAFKILEIKCTDGKYMITGQNELYDDVIQAVSSFTATHTPALLPAFDKTFVTQMSITSSLTLPPPYSQAERALQPDIAPLPNLSELDKEPEVPNPVSNAYSYGGNESPYVPISHWHYYRHHHRCHPKNVCHACCHAERGFFSPCQNGPLLALCIILLWIIVIVLLIIVAVPLSPCIAIVAIFFCCIVCCNN